MAGRGGGQHTAVCPRGYWRCTDAPDSPGSFPPVIPFWSPGSSVYGQFFWCIPFGDEVVITTKVLCLGVKVPLESRWDLARLSTQGRVVLQDHGGLGNAARLLACVYLN